MRRLIATAAVVGLLAVAPGAPGARGATAPTSYSPPLDARQALAAQARSLGLDGGTAAAPAHASLRQAVAAYLADKGALTPAVDAKLAALDAVPAVRQAALTRLVDAFIAFDAAAGRRQSLASDARLADLLAARAAMFDAADALPEPESALDAATAPLAVPPWFSLSMGDNDDVYETDIALLIDEGGNDTYRNNAGGSNLVGGSPCELAAVIPSPAAALIDEGGNDHYTSGRSCGANGGGAAMRAGFLYDGGPEDDTYLAGDFGVNGGGDFGGVGFLYDEHGGTSYTGGSNGVNGGGSLGIGLLVDGDGADFYTAGDNGTNGGAQFGAGGLLDLAHNDTYRAGSIGTNGGANGGVGFLIDVRGFDSYTAGSGGVNGGASTGLGLLLDLRDSDSYTDSEGGSGVNRTVAPKGVAGAQIDVAAPTVR